ncbi:unnamed protein product [Phytomonas sp. EM1]|nr:unnamed protein product [Phytomonas sp. EM1]|eukprot:CCW65689.1 unnamed protein product [Phytomonas sp. isolate EM1]
MKEHQRRVHRVIGELRDELLGKHRIDDLHANVIGEDMTIKSDKMPQTRQLHRDEVGNAGVVAVEIPQRLHPRPDLLDRQKHPIREKTQRKEVGVDDVEFMSFDELLTGLHAELRAQLDHPRAEDLKPLPPLPVVEVGVNQKVHQKCAVARFLRGLWEFGVGGVRFCREGAADGGGWRGWGDRSGRIPCRGRQRIPLHG